jgi:hypothetical protein
VLGIVVLILNDHVLKGNAPGWLTGKLSDFAGLLFFPFLAILAAALLRLPRPAWVGFTLTAAWFTAIKTLPWAAELTESIHPWPARIVVDPTDLVALVSLIPAIWIWNRTVRDEPTRTRARASTRFLLVGVAAMATMATSPYDPPVLGYLTVLDNQVYVVEPQPTPHRIWRSRDEGATWEQVRDAPPDLMSAIYGDANDVTNSQPDHKAWCAQDTSTLCQRSFPAPSNFQVSEDGGLTWKTDESGSIPPVFGPDPVPYIVASGYLCVADGMTCVRQIQGGVERRADYTTDGGRTWHAEPDPQGEWEALDREEGLIRCPVDQSQLCHRSFDRGLVWDVSEDGGISWQSDPSPDYLGQDWRLYGVACPGPGHCFRVIQTEPEDGFTHGNFSRLEETTDGGVTWHQSWYASPRFTGRAGMPDQVVVAGETLIVGLGTDGLLKRTPDGEWETIGLGNVESAAATTDLEESITLTWVVAVTVALVAFGILLLIQAGDPDEAKQTNPPWAGSLPLIVGAVLIPLYLAATAEYPYWLTNDRWIGIIFVLIPLALLIGTAVVVQSRSDTERVFKDLALAVVLAVIPFITTLGVWDYV